MEIIFTLNKQCNWTCEYCNQKLMDKTLCRSDEYYLEKIDEYLNLTKDVYLSFEISFCGGEPGLWSDTLWKGIFDLIIKYDQYIKEAKIFTNGLIFSHKLFSSFCNIPNKCYFVWHCTDKINKNKVIDIPFKSDSGYCINKNIVASIILGKDDIDSLDDFIQLNPNLGTINIDIIQESTYTINQSQFTEKDLSYLINKLIIFNNRIAKRTFDSIVMLRNHLKYEGIDAVQKICNKQNSVCLIDLYENCIYYCCNYDSKLELTPDNFIKHMDNKLFSNHECNNCMNQVFYYLEYNNAKPIY